jgi:tRNA U34 2-thiouridine synthase MnmA/TrmU
LISESGMKIDKALKIVGYKPRSGDIILGEDEDLLFAGAQLTGLITSERFDKRKPIHCYIKFKFLNEHVEANLFFKNNNSAYIEFCESVSPLLKREQIVLFDSNKRNAKVIGTALVNSRGEFKSIDRVGIYRKGDIDEDEIYTDFKF